MQMRSNPARAAGRARPPDRERPFSAPKAPGAPFIWKRAEGLTDCAGRSLGRRGRGRGPRGRARAGLGHAPGGGGRWARSRGCSAPELLLREAPPRARPPGARAPPTAPWPAGLGGPGPAVPQSRRLAPGCPTRRGRGSQPREQQARAPARRGGPAG